MQISDAEIFEILRNLNLDRSKTVESFLNICSFTVPEHNAGNVISKLLWDDLIIENLKDKTVAIKTNGYKFIKKYKSKLRRNKINEYTEFLKNLSWLLAFLISIIANIFFILNILNIL